MSLPQLSIFIILEEYYCRYGTDTRHNYGILFHLSLQNPLMDTAHSLQKNKNIPKNSVHDAKSITFSKRLILAHKGIVVRT